MTPLKDATDPTPADPTRGSPIPADAHVIVVGAMKSGTSTLFAHLAKHPRIAPSRVKEPEFFSEHQDHGSDVARYGELWDFDPDVHRFCVEASTGYTKYPDEPHVPDRMLDAAIHPKFIYAVRHPIDRMESQFNHGRVRRTEWAYDDFLEPGVLNLSRYYMQMQQYLLRFPDRDRYRIVDFDEMVSRPREMMDDVFDWLGLEPCPLRRDLHDNKTPEPSRLELLLADVDLSAPLALVPEPVKHAVRTVLRKHDPATERMTEEQRRRARAYLEQLAAEVDTFVVTQHDRATAERATERARAALDGDVDPETLAEEFVAEEINPGTTADTVAAGLFIGLERGICI
jgi:hypothetical protein